MALETNFTPPEKAVAEAETKKRNELIDWFSEVVDKAVVGLIVSGYMSYGYDYSVKETSDVDMQLIVTPETVNALKELDIFDGEELEKAIAGYLAGIYSQFSIVFEKNGVNMECHFWDMKAFISAITYKTAETKRLRSSIDTPSTDHGFSFERAESVKDFFGEIVSEYAVGVFPSYREENGVLYLCRPITNILGLPRVVKSSAELDQAIDQTWAETIEGLMTFADNGTLDLGTYNIENTLPGKNKMRQDVLDAIREKTKCCLSAREVLIS